MNTAEQRIEAHLHVMADRLDLIARQFRAGIPAVRDEILEINRTTEPGHERHKLVEDAIRKLTSSLKGMFDAPFPHEAQH
jgi:hypothetical protein